VDEATSNKLRNTTPHARAQLLVDARHLLGSQAMMSPSHQRSQLSAMSELRSPHSIGPMVRLLLVAGSATKSDPDPIMVLFSPLMGEAAYDSPVLMCRFRNVLKRIGQDGGESTTVYIRTC
jgi:hypothetical protein